MALQHPATHCNAFFFLWCPLPRLFRTRSLFVYRVSTMSRLPHSVLQCVVVSCSVLQCVAVATMRRLKKRLLSYRVHVRESSPHMHHLIYKKRVRSYRVSTMRRLPSHARGLFWKRDLFVCRCQQMSGPPSYARDPLQDFF